MTQKEIIAEVKKANMLKITKRGYITYLIDCKGYTEDEAKEYITNNGVLEIHKEAVAFCG